MFSGYYSYSKKTAKTTTLNPKDGAKQKSKKTRSPRLARTLNPKPKALKPQTLDPKTLNPKH